MGCQTKQLDSNQEPAENSRLTLGSSHASAGPSFRTILLCNSKGIALIDTEDYEWLSRYAWHNVKGYAYRGIHLPRLDGGQDRISIAMHTDIMQPPQGKEIHHINNNKRDNRKVNLQICTRSEHVLIDRRGQHTQGVKHANTISSYVGVTRNRNNSTKWTARFRGYIGSYTTEIEAAKAYDARAIEIYGPNARVNFPD